MERPFIYNPTPQVQQNLQKVSDSAKNAWEPLIKEKMIGFQAVSNDLDNIDKIKGELKGYHADMLTNRLNTLRSEMANTIKENGKIDLAKRAKIKGEIDQVKNLYLNSQESGEVVKEFLELAKDKSAYINDLAGFKVGLYNMVRNPEILMSPQGLRAKVEDLYSKNINYPLLVNERVNRDYIKDKGFVPYTYTDANGDLVEFNYKNIDGVRFNNATGKMEVDPEIAKKIAQAAFGEKELMAINNNLGVAKAFGGNAEDAAVKMVSDALLGGTSVQNYKRVTKATLDAQKSDATIKGYNASPEKLARDERNAESLIRSREASAAAAQGNLGLRAESNQLQREKFEYDKANPTQQKVGTYKNTPTSFKGGSKGIVKDFEYGDEEYQGVGIENDGSVFALKKQPNGSLRKIPQSGTKALALINGLDGDLKSDVQKLRNERLGGLAQPQKVLEPQGTPNKVKKDKPY